MCDLARATEVSLQLQCGFAAVSLWFRCAPYHHRRLFSGGEQSCDSARSIAPTEHTWEGKAYHTAKSPSWTCGSVTICRYLISRLFAMACLCHAFGLFIFSWWLN